VERAYEKMMTHHGYLIGSCDLDCASKLVTQKDTSDIGLLREAEPWEVPLAFLPGEDKDNVL